MNVTDPHLVRSKTASGAPKELLKTTTFLIKRLGFAAKDRSQEAFEGTGLAPYHFAVLALLEEDPRETQAAIADALGYDRSHVVRLLDELEERELVVRKRDPEDRRRHVVKMTPKGRKMLAQLRTLVRELEEGFLAPLDAEQRATLRELLQTLAGYHDPRCAMQGPVADPTQN
ncbi:MAG: MarR family winged helix-turn-helix transcriptional regulator [Gaiellales bacterium]